jgi:hypothetical protein
MNRMIGVCGVVFKAPEGVGGSKASTYLGRAGGVVGQAKEETP